MTGGWTPGRWDSRLQIHLCVLLWGFTAILGRLISLGALPLVFWRMAMVAACLFLWPPVWRALAAAPARRVPTRSWWTYSTSSYGRAAARGRY